MSMTLRALLMPVLAIVVVLALGACGPGKSPNAASSSVSTQAPACGKQVDATASAAPDSAKPSDKSHPRLKVTTFDGKTYDLAGQCGHWVVVNFWATWCGPCLQEMPDLTAFTKTHTDVAVIGLDYEEIERPALSDFLKQHTPGYPIALIDTYHPPQDFDEPRALPTSYLIGPDGAVVHKFLGPVTIKELQQQIDRAKSAG